VTLALLWRYRSPLAIGGLVLVLWLGFLHLMAVERDKGAMAERHRQDSVVIAGLQKAIDTNTTRLRVDTVELTRVVRHYDTLTVERHLTDTVWVAKALDAADSVKRACQRVQNDCAVLLLQKDSLVRLLRDRIVSDVKLKAPSKFHLAVKLAGAAAVGYLVGRHR
jgi:hypothetical protein